MKKWFIRLIFICTLIGGIGLLLYPLISNYVNDMNQTKSVAAYVEEAENIPEERKKELLAEAVAYNKDLYYSTNRYVMTDEQKARYESTLDVSGTGMMAYVEIPKLDIILPIYHGTDAGVLQVAIGHIAGSSLPVGGESTHTVISGHTGLPSADLFTDIDTLELGDIFFINVLDKTLAYEVDDINVVNPDEIGKIQIEGGEDLCTLVTCTPYGVNTHRLLVRGHRVDYQREDNNVAEVINSKMMNPYIIIIILAIIAIIIFIIIRLVIKKRKSKKDKV